MVPYLYDAILQQTVDCITIATHVNGWIEQLPNDTMIAPNRNLVLQIPYQIK